MSRWTRVITGANRPGYRSWARWYIIGTRWWRGWMLAAVTAGLVLWVADAVAAHPHVTWQDLQQAGPERTLLYLTYISLLLGGSIWLLRRYKA